MCIRDRRVTLAKNWGADIFVSLHINSASPGATGAEVWYPNSSYNSGIHKMCIRDRQFP